LSAECDESEFTVVSFEIGMSARRGATAEEAATFVAIESAGSAGCAVVSTGVAATSLSCLANKAAVDRVDDATSRGKAAGTGATGVVGDDCAG